MPNVYAILGESNARKSSTVRALTGVFQWQSAWSVATTTHTPLDIHIEVSSLQESNISPQGFVDKIDAVNRNRASLNPPYPDVANILVPIWISAGNNLPPGINYLQHFAQQPGWNISQIVVLGAAALPPALPVGVPAHLISGSVSMPANAIASQIRGFWNWL